MVIRRTISTLRGNSISIEGNAHSLLYSLGVEFRMFFELANMVGFVVEILP
jgi:hypothetical protein